MIVTDNTNRLNQTTLLTQVIKQEIAVNNNKIPFDDYMQLALYAPQLGYYNNTQTKFGPQGDFITAPELGDKFAYCISQQITQIFNKINQRNILEFGAGSGMLAANLLLSFDKQQISIDTYYILEVSSYLQQQQKILLQKLCPNLYSKIVWLNSLPKFPFTGVILANEVLDAMPIKMFNFHNEQLKEYYVTSSNDQLQLITASPTPQLTKAFKELNLPNYLATLKTPYTSEINLLHTPWIKSLSEILHSGAILLCDYGFGRSEYYHPQRNTGTLICHYQHHSNPNPLSNPGMQDITAHVDFTTIAEAATKHDLLVSGYTNLAVFLINCDLMNVLGNTPTEMQEVITLTSPAEMGELFKVMLLVRDIEVCAVGFSEFDRRQVL